MYGVQDGMQGQESLGVLKGIGYVSEGKYGKMNNCKVVFSREKDYTGNGKEWHTCRCESDRWFVKEYEEGRIELTRDEDEAMRFFSDGDVDECMKVILEKYHPWTLAIWDYVGDRGVSECVHYPNGHWWENGDLQPSLMNKSVGDWKREHGM